MRTTYTSNGLSINSVETVADRQELVPGWSQALAQLCHVMLIGAGLNSHVGNGLARKGYGRISIVDADHVSPSNLSRQLYRERDLGKPKATALARGLAEVSPHRTLIHAHESWHNQIDLRKSKPNVIVCAVDTTIKNTRQDICTQAFKHRIPTVFCAVTPNADTGYVMIQTPGEACWACVLKPHAIKDETPNADRCAPVGATIDILNVAAGYALYAIDTLVMNRPRDWNFLSFSLSRGEYGKGGRVKPRADCPVCGTG